MTEPLPATDKTQSKLTSDNAQPSIYNRDCPSRFLLARIGDKWTAIILGKLIAHPVRFGALKRECDGISQKMLTQSLRNLERDGFISRKILNPKPLQVEYSITALGSELFGLLEPLIDWVHNNYLAVIENHGT